MMFNSFLSILAAAINAYLKYGITSTQFTLAKQLQALEGHVISVTLLPFGFTFQMTFSQQEIVLTPHDLLTAETKITGTPLQLCRVMLTKHRRHTFFADDVKIEGNAELGQQVVDLFDVIPFDWEDYLSQLIGDTKAYHTGRFVRGINKWLHQVENSFSQNVNEYVHEEAAWLASRDALNDFFTEIDALRMDVDRMEARIKKLNVSMINHEEKQ